eukprot:g13630.t1
MEAFRNSSHGSFFWNWKEDPEDKEWNFHRPFATFERQDILHPSPEDPVVYYGDTVYLRVFHGMYMDVQGRQVDCSWADKGQWQAFIFHEAWPCKEPRPLDKQTSSRRPVKHRDIVRIQGHNKHFVAVTSSASEGAPVVATRKQSGRETEFEVFLESSSILKHRGKAYFFSRATSTTIDADDEADGIFARWADFGDWQAITVERPPELQRAVALPQPLPQPRPRRRTKGPPGPKDSPVEDKAAVKRKADVLSEGEPGEVACECDNACQRCCPEFCKPAGTWRPRQQVGRCSGLKAL